MNVIKVERPGESSGFIRSVYVSDRCHNLIKKFGVVGESEATRFNDTEAKLVLGFIGREAQRKGHTLEVVNVEN